ncbi:DUF4926 domain-containing protein [Fortiea sp. LEGE XX443]|uniref:DUF4926 domain-containing protein n=1 Tax=Fortiea sp. LEGE XX443 TaxID=1828611 RepID=UPI0018818198|nr:DUF4926 domain-containing protein [Fortiea sp. LEGE XX443]MBE9007425.1 DUF4926 domain-containing protein [Fortiea sp. LEGE XX443]
MTKVSLFQWAELKQDVPNSPVKAGHKGVVLDYLNPTPTQKEPGYILEVFQNGETLDVVSVPISWVKLLPKIWRSTESTTKQTA